MSALWGLGLTQIVGYGTLYYAFSILVPDIAGQLGETEQWVFGVFSVSLLFGGLLAPLAGRLTDRFGAGQIMTLGSLFAALSLVATAVSPGPVTFCLAMIFMQAVSAMVLYSAAFVAIVQLGGRSAQTSIVHLTLIAGFASTIFWPVTSFLHDHLAWRQVYLLYAALNLGICLPVHVWIARLSRTRSAEDAKAARTAQPDRRRPTGTNDRLIFALMLIGFAVEGFALSAILNHMVPLTKLLGLGVFGLYVAAIFGPAQVASRFVNLLFGGGLSQAWLAVIATTFLPVAILVLLISLPWIEGAVVFALFVGLGSGLTSIVGGTLPLELFGREGYGGRLGWATFARQFMSSLAPFAFSAAVAGIGVYPSLWIIGATGLVGMLAFLAIPFLVDNQTMVPSDLAEQRMPPR